ncbi:MAG: bifunctional 5,10-methylene-tetrahydrofolate dehydrogenase/5,10-methylene-tetrahydrofolate cyclohydrolase [Candidatus Kerfeldbacteria bacterium CG08_land_8_20_14_0_20_40_16]|uniref:Bifunctional protein FolD n=1 Tax=Candidatus Kerfeldbacteria bacterium CG08_land_8_20_14_0_20_40_16 TaxID=2014244 RepID=A0A2H0YY96_9BACT|nr:MAG: bifunctional 5,10-methylene-tetrahydrofolate dehydrogenase/5,10-methylene-tetrahydrofolate cyclohydrolase [Candidatus Kerfeldbacteria bacterium CG08_land_8_20_14_0_20_40_16]
MTKILSGKKIAEGILRNLSEKIAQASLKPGLAVVLVGDDPASHLYTELKGEACEQVGIHYERHLFPQTANQEEVIEKIKKLNNQKDIHGIIVQLPLPKQLSESEIISAIAPEKDADGFHPENIQKFQQGQPVVVSPLLQTIETFLKQTGEPLTGKTGVVFGNSDLFVQNVEIILRRMGVRTKHFHALNYESIEFLKQGDVVVIALGRAKCLKEEMVMPGVIIIDVGITKTNGQIIGDVDRKSVAGKAGYLTPVPGGVGPMTVAYLLENTYQLAKKINEKQ